jgi:hypothetical protein
LLVVGVTASLPFQVCGIPSSALLGANAAQMKFIKVCVEKDECDALYYTHSAVVL